MKKIIKEDGVFLYELKGRLPRVFFITDLSRPFRAEPARSLQVKEYRSGFAEIDIFTEKEGYLVFSENYYSGWTVYVNGQEKDIMLVEDIVQAVKLDKGKHKVVFRFKPEI